MLESFALIAMKEADIQDASTADLTPERIQAQLELMTLDEVFRSSKRSIAFLKYVVHEALNGSADQIKERTVGVEVFGRSSSYDTNLDHVVRTAATELRKRLAIYYGDEKHRSELRISLVPGSYIPRFTLPHQTAHLVHDAEVAHHQPAILNHGQHDAVEPVTDPSHNASDTPPRGARRRSKWRLVFALCAVVLASGLLGYRWLHEPPAEFAFWKPVLDTPGPVLLAVGDVPNGPPTLPNAPGNESVSTPVPSADSSQTVPFADAVTIARVVGALEARNKKVLIRRENSSSFSDLREGAVVLIGAFNNEWSLRLTHSLRYSLALDPEQHLIYIRDAKNPASRNWSWRTNQPRDHIRGINSPKFQDYALISRIQDSETGHVVLAIGGLYTYGTLAAGEFLTDPELMKATATEIQRAGNRNLQIVLGTTVTDDTPGPPRVLAVSTE
jgi:hypothetical protein